MRANLHKRLKQLEQARGAAVKVVSYHEYQEQGRLAVERMRERLRVEGFEQQLSESFADTVARASGITCHELRHQLIERAAGRL